MRYRTSIGLFIVIALSVLLAIQIRFVLNVNFSANKLVVDVDGDVNVISFFPPDCYWKCYLRNNAHRMVQTIPSWDEEAALEHYKTIGSKQNMQCSCKIILLAGPHKAASTTIQHNAILYSDMINVPWKWIPSPKSSSKSSSKGFAPFIQTFYGLKNRNHTGFEKEKMKMKMAVHDMYNEKGYNIIFGGEAIDEINRPSFNNSLIDEILDIIPGGGGGEATSAITSAIEHKRKHLTAVVVYRAPRAGHLKSLWKQLSFIYNRTMTFHEFLCDDYMYERFQSIDSLLLTQTLLIDKGINVKLIDMSGVLSTKGIDFFSVLGCDIMELPCYRNENNELLPLFISREETVKDMTRSRNVRKGDIMNITESQLDEIDTILKHYDCGYKHLLEKTKMKHGDTSFDILYGDLLLSNLKECDASPLFQGLIPPTRNETILSIQKAMKCE